MQDFSTGGGGGNISATVQTPTPRYMGGGDICYYWLDWASEERGPSHHALHTKYIIENPNQSEILCFVTYFNQLAFELCVSVKISGS